MKGIYSQYRNTKQPYRRDCQNNWNYSEGPSALCCNNIVIACLWLLAHKHTLFFYDSIRFLDDCEVNKFAFFPRLLWIIGWNAAPRKDVSGSGKNARIQKEYGVGIPQARSWDNRHYDNRNSQRVDRRRLISPCIVSRSQSYSSENHCRIVPVTLILVSVVRPLPALYLTFLRDIKNQEFLRVCL